MKRIKSALLTATLLSAISVGFTAIAAPASSNAKVSGQVAVDGTTLTPTHVLAFRQRNQNDASQFETVVILTNSDLDPKVALEIDAYTAAINDPATQGNHAKFFISEKGAVILNANVDGTQHMHGTESMFGEPAGLKATCAHNSKERIACTIEDVKRAGSKLQASQAAQSAVDIKASQAAQSAVDIKASQAAQSAVDIQVALQFDVPVQARASGKAIPNAAQSPAAKSLVALLEAIKGNNLQSILAGLSADEAQSYQRDYNTEAENLSSAKKILGAILPKKAKVIAAEQLADDRVLLEVQGEAFPGRNMLYLVEMRKEKGAWVYDATYPLGLLPK
jgi:hypothetical protein